MGTFLFWGGQHKKSISTAVKCHIWKYMGWVATADFFNKALTTLPTDMYDKVQTSNAQINTCKKNLSLY